MSSNNLRQICLDVLELVGGSVSYESLYKLIEKLHPDVEITEGNLYGILMDLRSEGIVERNDVWKVISFKDEVTHLNSKLSRVYKRLKKMEEKKSKSLISSTTVSSTESASESTPEEDILVDMASFNSSECYTLNVTKKTCTCKDYEYRGGPNYLCKHLKQLVVNPELYGLNPSDLVEIAALLSA